MFEKVNPSHPDKVADRIAGALVDLAYTKKENPKVAAEVLIGHGTCHIIIETDTPVSWAEAHQIVKRIAGDGVQTDLVVVPQDEHLADNQGGAIRCGDNGIFKGVPKTQEQVRLTTLAKHLYHKYPTDGKHVLDRNRLIVCQSNANKETLGSEIRHFHPEWNIQVNPIGDWTGGTNVDTGATNRKLGSDMGDAVTGGGLHGKDLSKADVSVNIWCHVQAIATGQTITASCAIGDTEINGIPYADIVKTARTYIDNIGGFEALAEWGLV